MLRQTILSTHFSLLLIHACSCHHICVLLCRSAGLAFFYGGMVNAKNVVSTIMQSYITMSTITIIWIFVG